MGRKSLERGLVWRVTGKVERGELRFVLCKRG